MLDDDLRELRTAEEFFDYFGVAYDVHVVAVNRLRILKRFHDYLEAAQMPSPFDATRKAVCAGFLLQAYKDCQAPRPVPTGSGSHAGTAGAVTSFIPLLQVRM